MNAVARTLLVFVKIVGGLLLLVAAAGGAAAAGPALGLPLLLVVLLANGWAVYAFLRYRQGLQDELLAVLTATAEARMPLVSGVDAYLDSRPRPNDLAAVFRWLSFLALPLYAYTRLWLGWRRFDQLVEDLAARLEAGESLAEALRWVPGVAAREVRLAAEVGEATGTLGPTLRCADRERWSAAWLEVAPRLVYPLLVLVFVTSLTTFLMTVIFPRFLRIYQELGEDLPGETVRLVEWWAVAEDYLALASVGFLPFLVALAAVVANPTVRWHTPLLGRLYRWGVQAEVLRTLGRLLAAGQTVPQSLAFLADCPDLPGVVRRRVEAAVRGVERGEPLDRSLSAAGLLPSSMGPLVQASERTRTLPITLLELGDHLAGRAFRTVRRLSLLASPLMVLAVGAVVGFIAVGMFMPLIHLLTSLAE